MAEGPAQEALREALRREILRAIELVRGARSKEELRAVYRAFVYRRYLGDSIRYDDEGEYYEHLARPEEVDPRRVQPRLAVVSTERERRLFRYLTYYWSFPVSEGVGRRVKFIVYDEQNGKVVGLVGLKDPVFGLRARDRHIGWDAATRREYLVHVMDAHVLGAVPPYSDLLGGKLVASLLQSREVLEALESRYPFRHGFPVVLYTTTTVYGRSAMLDRTAWVYVGETRGRSTFHLNYRRLRELLGNSDGARSYKFEHGPNYPLRLARLASRVLGFDVTDVGVRRGVYVLPLASNYREALNGRERPTYDLVRPLDEIAGYARERWIVPRASRVRPRPPPRVSEIMEEARRLAEALGLL